MGEILCTRSPYREPGQSGVRVRQSTVVHCHSIAGGVRIKEPQQWDTRIYENVESGAEVPSRIHISCYPQRGVVDIIQPAALSLVWHLLYGRTL